MILRLLALCLAGGGAYALLRGFPDGLPVLVRSCLAVLLLVGGLAWWAVGRGKDELPVAKGLRKPGWRDFLAMGMGILALECGFLWVLSAAPEPLENVAIMIEGKFQPDAAAERAGRASAGDKGNWLWSDEGRRELPKRTNLKPGAKPEVFVKLPRTEDAERLLNRKVYVRAFVLDQFKDGVWSLGGGEVEELKADANGWIGLGQRSEGEILHEVFHGKEVGGNDVLTALQGVRAVRLPSLRLAADGMGFLPDISGPSGFGYQAGSVPMGLEDLPKANDWGAAMPVGSGGRFADLVSKAAGQGDLLEKLLNIQSFLRENYGYSLMTENRKDLDPLDNFLFEEKRGHCEFFATAGALMARELGVQTRVAYGWAGGEYFKESQMFVFRAREAHAWVEVKTKLHGWVVMEPTPPVVLSGGGAPRVAGAGEALPSPEEVLAEDPDARAAEAGNVEGIALGLMAAFGGVGAFIFLLRGMGKSDASRGGTDLRASKRKGGYFSLWESVCERKGMKRRGGQTLKGQLGEMEGPPHFADELREYHYSLRYEEKQPDEESEVRLVGKISSWE